MVPRSKVDSHKVLDVYLFLVDRGILLIVPPLCLPDFLLHDKRKKMESTTLRTIGLSICISLLLSIYVGHIHTHVYVSVDLQWDIHLEGSRDRVLGKRRIQTKSNKTVNSENSKKREKYLFLESQRILLSR